VWALGLSACGGGGGNGALTGPPPPPGGGGSGLTVGGTVAGLKTNATVVLLNNGGNSLSVTADGTFKFSTTLTTGTAYSVTVGTQPAGQFCTVANGSGTIASSAITNVSVSCTPQIGKFVYVPNSDSNDVSAYSIDATTGALTEIAGSPFAADQAPALATADPAAKFLYVINQGNPIVAPTFSSYAIGANGALTENQASPFPVTTGLPPPSPALFNKPIVHSSGKYLYITNAANGLLYGESADATGTLMELPGMPQRAGDVAGYGVFDPTGTFLYVPHDSFNFTANRGAVAIFKLNPNSGVLTSQGELATNATRAFFTALTPSGKFLLVANQFSSANTAPGRIAVFMLDASSGIPTPVAGSPFATDGITSVVVAHPTKNFVYANSAVGADLTSSITAFKIDPDTGVLTPVTGSPFATGGKTASFIRIDPAGRFLYVANRDSDNIAAFAIDQTTGALTAVPGSPFATDKAPLATLDPSGRFLYSTNSDTTANTIASYSINQTTGALTLVNKLPTGAHPVMAEVVGGQTP
jgi:6-phosphogluconolactonase (cycloisomerase 2 family)